MFVSSDPGWEEGEGHTSTVVYGRIPSTPEGDGEVTYLICEASVTVFLAR